MSTDNLFEKPREAAEWHKTIQMHSRLRGNPLYEEGGGPERTGIWGGRPIISRDSPINGGVYLGAGPHEALVIDDQKYPEELNRVYNGVISQMARQDGKSVFQKVFGVVGENLGGRQGQKLIDRVEAEVDKLTAKYGPDTKVPINDFIRKKIGYCRHRAVLGAYILERLVKEGHIRGSVSVDRNEVPGLGGHAWVRWTEPSGQVYILDSAIGYVGSLDTAPAVWNYRRPGE